MIKLSLHQIEQAIASADKQKQRRLLRDLPHILKISQPNLALLKIAEASFDFWDNDEDAIYDKL